MNTVLAAGTFDHVHLGHRYFLTQSKKQGDKLVVIVARDSTVEKRKGRKPKYHERTRKEEVEELGIADEIRLGNVEGSIFDIIKEVKPDIICLGYDQAVSEEELAEELKKRKLKASVVRIDSFQPEIYKSSKLK